MEINFEGIEYKRFKSKEIKVCYCRLMVVSFIVVLYDILIEQVYDVFVVVIFVGYLVFQKKVGELDVVRLVYGFIVWFKQNYVFGNKFYFLFFEV